LLTHPRAQVIGIAGRNVGRARELAARFGIAGVYRDERELCGRDDIDAITVCTATSVHREHALSALAQRKHVFCEKPLGVTVADAEEMTRAAQASGRVHQIAFLYRYLFGVEELRRRVRSGDVGEPFLVRAHHEYWDIVRDGRRIPWQSMPIAAGVGVLQDTGPHLLDLARHLLGPIAAVHCVLHRAPGRQSEGVDHGGGSPDDIATVSLQLACGARGHLHASRITPSRESNFVQVIGSEGALEALLSRGHAEGLRGIRPGGSWQALKLPKAPHGAPHALGRMMRSFVDACLQGELSERDASFHDGLAVQRALCAAERSTEGWVPVSA
jgi:predicted dehydrogenase